MTIDPPCPFGDRARGCDFGCSPCFFSPTNYECTVYVDGFNFYYGAVKGTPYKWLDFNKLFGFLLPKNNITKIKYFSAKIIPRPQDLDQLQRQETYLRALRTLPNVENGPGLF